MTQAVRIPPELADFGRPVGAYQPLLPRQQVIQRSLDARLTAGRTEIRPRRAAAAPAVADYLPPDRGPWILRQAGDRYLAKFIQPMNFKELRQRARKDPLREALIWL